MEKNYIFSIKNFVHKKCIEASGISPIYTYLFVIIVIVDMQLKWFLPLYTYLLTFVALQPEVAHN